MKRNRKHMNGKRLISLLLVLAFAVSCLSFEAFAEAGDPIPAYKLENGTEIDVRAIEEVKGKLPVDATGEYPANTRSELPGVLTSRLLEVYSTYLFFNPMYLSNYYAAFNGVILLYSSNGGSTWNYYPEVIPYWKIVTVTGLNPNTDYLIQLSNPSYQNLGLYKVHTGAADTPIKSIQVKAVNVRKHRVRNRTYWYGFLLPGYHTEYTWRVRVTVKMRRRPGAPGIYINGVWVGGNRKKYSKVMPTRYRTTNKPKRCGRYTVSVYSAFDGNGYGGFSPLVQKSKKIR